MKVRIISGVLMGLFALGMIILGGIPFGIFIFVAALIALHEFYNAFENIGYKPFRLTGMLYSVLIVIAVFVSNAKPLALTFNFKPDVDFFPVFQTVVLLFMLSIIVIRNKKHNIMDCVISFFGAYYIPVLLSFAVLLRNMEHGAYLIFLVLLGTVASDTCALMFGMLWGKKKLIPEVSPNKTVMGSIGSFVGAAFFVTLYGIILNATGAVMIPWYNFTIIGIILGGTSQLGDLSASSIKRFCKIKDFGNIIPGHGGIMDRIDSELFNLPIVFFYFWLVNL